MVSTKLSHFESRREQIHFCQRCAKEAQGRLIGNQGQSFGWHCKKCATKRLKDCKRERALRDEDI